MELLKKIVIGAIPAVNSAFFSNNQDDEKNIDEDRAVGDEIVLE